MTILLWSQNVRWFGCLVVELRVKWLLHRMTSFRFWAKWVINNPSQFPSGGWQFQGAITTWNGCLLLGTFKGWLQISVKGIERINFGWYAFFYNVVPFTSWPLPLKIKGDPTVDNLLWKVPIVSFSQECPKLWFRFMCNIKPHCSLTYADKY